MTIFQQRLKEIMEEKNIKAAAISKSTGISTGTISKYLSDEKKRPDFTLVIKIAKFLDVAVEWLGGTKDVREPFEPPKILPIYDKLSTVGKKEVYDFACYLLNKETNQDLINEEAATYEIKLLGKTAAGSGVINGDALNETISVHDVPKGANFVLVVKGDSMEPTIKDGSIVFVKHQENVENGEIAIIDMDGEVTCKEAYYTNGILELRSINPSYEPMYPKNARIIGKVIL